MKIYNEKIIKMYNKKNIKCITKKYKSLHNSKLYNITIISIFYFTFQKSHHAYQKHITKKIFYNEKYKNIYNEKKKL